MKDLYMTLPPLASDYGGACEVLYELGGLVLIHDATGCTVNYVTFDEPRWYDRSGTVFCSGLTEIDAVMGDDNVLIEKALRAAEILKPNFIAYVGSSVPMVVGTDFYGIAAETEARSGIPSFGFDCNGIRSYVEGATEVITSILGRFCGDKTENSGTLLLGLLPLDDADLEDTDRICGLIPDLRASVSFNFSFDDLRDVQNAERIIVASAAGLPAAKMLNERYDIPYTIGLPLKPCSKHHGTTLVIGEDVRAYSLAKALGNSKSLDIFTKDGLCDYHTLNEDDIMRIAEGYDNVIADPCFKPLVKGNFVPLPTISVSGGIFAKTVSATDTDAISNLLI